MPADITLTAYNWTEMHESSGRVIWEVDCGAYWPTREEAEAAIARYRAAVVESSPEVARLRATLREAEAVAALRRERDELRATLTAVRDDAYVIGEECDEHNGTIGQRPATGCPTCAMAWRVHAALNPAGDDHG